MSIPARTAVFMMLGGIVLCAAENSEDFISEFEYGQMLYQNPRGVSCVPCHGDRAEGKEIARYRDAAGREIILRGPDIRSADLHKIMETVKKGPGVMPRYFFTDKEIKAIYNYIQNVGADGEKKE